MRSYERSGITVDQCTECRGIFLDRGELERLLDAESASPPARNDAKPSDPGDPRIEVATRYRGSRDDDDSHDSNDDERYGQERGLPRDDRRNAGRREGRMSSLFDLFGGGD
jgi:Zn-finger nucleic acid-binding protein